MVKNHVIIVAAGTGNRFGGFVPKQFLPLCGRPVLMRCIDNFRAALPGCHITLVISEPELDRWQNLCKEYGFESPEIVFGGDTRTESVRNALNHLQDMAVDDNDVILIQDGARPFIDAATVQKMSEMVASGDAKAVVPALPMTDSIMTSSDSDAHSVRRSSIVRVQTPQVFLADTIFDAYDAMESDAAVTDDASVVDNYSYTGIHLIKGWEHNIKITRPLDFKIAELLLK